MRLQFGEALRPQLGKFSSLTTQNYVRAASSSSTSLGGSGASPYHFEDEDDDDDEYELSFVIAKVLPGLRAMPTLEAKDVYA